jgi:hypothetical protein
MMGVLIRDAMLEGSASVSKQNQASAGDEA